MCIFKLTEREARVIHCLLKRRLRKLGKGARERLENEKETLESCFYMFEGCMDFEGIFDDPQPHTFQLQVGRTGLTDAIDPGEERNDDSACVEVVTPPKSFRRYVATLAANTRKEACFLVDVETDLDTPEIRYEIGENLLNCVTADEYRDGPEHWQNEDPHMQKVERSEDTEADFVVSFRAPEEPGESGQLDFQDLRFRERRADEVQDADEEVLTDKDRSLIYQILHSEATTLTHRNRPEEAVEHRELLNKIGYNGRRISTHLRVVHSDQEG